MLSERQETIGGWIALAIFFGILFVGGLRSHEPPQTPGINAQQHTGDGVGSQQSPTNAPSRLENQGGEQKSSGARHDASEADIFGVKRGEWLIFVATILLWASTQMLVREAKATSRRQLRAYIFAEPRTLGVGMIPGSVIKEIQIQYEIKNWGVTPAYRIRNAAYICRMPDPLPATFIVESPKWDDPRHTTLGPKQSLFSTSNDKSYSAPVAGEKDYIVGLIEYFDTFGRKKRTTKFCYAVDVQDFVARKLRDPSLSGNDVKFWIAPQHNEAD
jgi:hypothetical protein